jgi:hypothetical protein
MPPGQKLEVSWDVEDYHPELVEDLRINQKVIPIYIAQVIKAVQNSCNHPDTKPRIVTKQLIKERIDLCHNLLMMMRQEMYWALRRCCEALPETLIEVLRQGRKEEDVVKDKDDRPTWVRENPEPREAYIVDEVADPKEGEVLIPKEVEDAFEKDNG